MSGLLTLTVLNTKMNEVPNKCSFVTTSVLNTKNSKIEIASWDFLIMPNILLLKKSKTKMFVARLTQANLETKIDFDNKLIHFNRKIISNKIEVLK